MLENQNTRKMFEPDKDGNTWQIRANAKIEQLQNEKDIINAIKIRMEWLFHLIIMKIEQLINERDIINTIKIKRMERLDHLITMKIKQLYNEKYIINTIKIRRMEWLGYLITLKVDKITKKIYNGKLMGKRSVRRRRNRWLEVVGKELAQKQIKN